MQKNYTVKEVFFSIQGEGAHRGRHAVFCRFSGCNLWSGLEKDRASAICDFCDTDFVGINSDGGKFNSAGSVADAVLEKWPPEQPNQLVICTGGEPLLQLDTNLLEEFHARGFEVALETNGTLPAPPGIDWICVSPKMGTELVLKRGNELKLVYPQLNCEPGEFLQYEFDHFFLQPMDGPRQIQNTALAVEYCEQHQPWEISIQTQKLINVR
ncbi:7-carboxy-7-deazaguanine synthase [Mariniblastus sp.]|nr:7-carboxy-7-deazaguanine synthase [Mariniblastus sp.]MDB4756752.1 7-carboxy-7-deazaguanine synthase [Mariniblastus sp.]